MVEIKNPILSIILSHLCRHINFGHVGWILQHHPTQIISSDPLYALIGIILGILPCLLLQQIRNQYLS